MPVFTPLYEQLDRVLASNDEDCLDDLPMWMPLFFIAEPAAMRWYGTGDLEEAQGALTRAQSAWNIGRRRPRRREREWAALEHELTSWLHSASDAKEMVLRAGLWPDDRRVVTRAEIHVGPTGEWRLDIETT